MNVSGLGGVKRWTQYRGIVDNRNVDALLDRENTRTLVWNRTLTNRRS